MHYYWLKKKWFLDAIVSNFLFTLLLTTAPTEMTINAEINYADVSSYSANPLDVSNDIESTIEFEDVFALAFEVVCQNEYATQLNSTFIMIDALPLEGEVADFLAYDIVNDLSSISAITSAPAIPIVTTQSNISLSVIANNLRIIIPSSTVDTRLSTITCGSQVVNVTSFSALTVTIPTYVLSNSAQVVDLEETTLDILIKSTVDVTGTFNSVSPLHSTPSSIYTQEIDTTLGFYFYSVLELAIDSIQVQSVEVYTTIELIEYMTRFSDLNDLRVGDFAGLQFKNLRWLQ